MPLAEYLSLMPGLLPQWYMPAATSRGGRAWKVAVVVVILATFLAIDISGLCSTYGVGRPGVTPGWTVPVGGGPGSRPAPRPTVG